MPADDTNGPGGRTALTGFLTNADDSLRVVYGDTPPQPPQPARFVARVAFPEDAPSDEEWREREEADEAEDAYELEAAEEPDEADDLDWQEWQEAERSPGLRGVAVAILVLVLGGGGVAAIGWNLTHQKHDIQPAEASLTLAAPAPAPPQLQIAAATPPAAATEREPPAIQAAPPAETTATAPDVAPTADATADTAAEPQAPRAAVDRPVRHAPATETARSDKPPAAKATRKETPRATAKETPKLASTKATAKPIAPARGKSGVDCSHPQTVSRHMACDPALADANHQVGEAYLAAVVAGASTDQLRSEQNDWLSVRDDAAKRSPAELAAAYRARIDALDRQRAQALNEPPH